MIFFRVVDMKRKVIQIANSTQLVSLPRKWAIENNILKGDELNLEIQDSSLTISKTAKNNPSRTISIDCKGFGRNIKRVIGALYSAGYDEIIVHYSGYSDLQPVQTIMREGCIGFELIEQKPNYVVLKKVSETMDEEFEPVVKRMIMYLITMSKEALAALKNPQKDRLQYVIEMDLGINKFIDFCRRVLSNGSNRANWALFPALHTIEQTGDEYKNLCRMISRGKEKPTQRMIDLLSEINMFVELSYELMFKFSIPVLQKAYTRKKELQSTIDNIRSDASADDLRTLHYLSNIVEIIDSIDSHVLINYCLKHKATTLGTSPETSAPNDRAV